MCDSGCAIIKESLGRVVVDVLSRMSTIEGVLSSAYDKSKNQPLGRSIRVTVLIVFLCELGGRIDCIIF